MEVAGLSQPIRDWFEAIRAPEYTGVNRCIPCTMVNLTIAAVVAVALAMISRPVAGGAFVLMLGLIYVRGYLVPGTPTLTKRYLPAPVLAAFGHEAQTPSAADFDPEAVLLETGVIVEDARGTDFEVAPEFKATWIERYEAVTASEADVSLLAELVAVEPDRLDIEWHGNAFVAWMDDTWIGQWESRVAFLADVAASEILPAYVPEWGQLSLAHRSNTLGVLRLFIERCPACNGVVALEAEVKESCCREVDVIATTCRGCGERIFEAVYEPEAMQAAHGDADAAPAA